MRPVARAEAVAELSEGLATIETGLRIATSDSAAPITILTEGNNVLHLKRWAALFFSRRLRCSTSCQTERARRAEFLRSTACKNE